MVYIAGPTPIFIIPDNVYQQLYASYNAATGQAANGSTGGIDSPVSGNIQAWVDGINQAIASNGGQVPQNMQQMVNFMTQSIPIYDNNGNQAGTTQLANFSDSGTTEYQTLSLNSSILTNLQTQQNSSPYAGSLIMVALSDNVLNDPSAINNAVQTAWQSATVAHESTHAGNDYDLETNYGGNVDLWLNGGTDSGGDAIPASPTASYIHGLPGVVQAFFDVFLTTSGTGYNIGNPMSVVDESSAYANTFNTIVTTLLSNNSGLGDDASALQWALGQAGIANSIVNTNQDGSLQVKTEGNTINIYNIDNPSQMAIMEITSLGTENLYTSVGNAGSMDYSFGVSKAGEPYLVNITGNGNSILSPGQDLNLQIDVPGVGTVTLSQSGLALPQGVDIIQQTDINQAMVNLLVNGQGSATISFMIRDDNGNSTTPAYNLVINGNDWSYTMPDGTPLVLLPDVNGSSGTYLYEVQQTADGTQYQQIDGTGQLTGVSVSKNNDGTVIFSDGQGDTLTHDTDGTSVAQITVASGDPNSAAYEQQTITVNLDMSGNVISWKDDSGTHNGDSAAFAAALSQLGLAPISTVLPDLTDPSSVSEYLVNASQEVNSQQNNQNPGDPGDPGDPFGGDGQVTT